MDPVTLSLILALIQVAYKLAPEVVALIERARAGEKITPAEVEATQRAVLASVDRWKRAGDKPGKSE